MTNNEAKIKMQEVLKEVLAPITFGIIKDELSRRLLDAIEYQKMNEEISELKQTIDDLDWTKPEMGQ